MKKICIAIILALTIAITVGCANNDENKTHVDAVVVDDDGNSKDEDDSVDTEPSEETEVKKSSGNEQKEQPIEKHDPKTIEKDGAIFKVVEDDDDLQNQIIELNDNASPEEPPELFVYYYDEKAGLVAEVAKNSWAGVEYDRMSMEQLIVEDSDKTMRVLTDTDIVLQFKDKDTSPSKISIEDYLILGRDGNDIKGNSMYREADVNEDGNIHFRLGHHPSMKLLSSTGDFATGKEFRVIKIHASWNEGNEAEYGFGVRVDPESWEEFFGDDYKEIEKNLSKVKEKYVNGDFSEYLNGYGPVLIDLDGKYPDEIERKLFFEQLNNTKRRGGVDSIGTWIIKTDEGDPIYTSIRIKGFRLLGLADTSDDSFGSFFGLHREYDEDFESISKKLTGMDSLK